MIDKIEDYHNEFKEILNDSLEKEAIGFLNSNGGNIFIGIDNFGKIVGLTEDIDKLQLTIKDRLMNNIEPSTLGLFDINIEDFEDKKYIHITIATGNKKPYYLKKKGITPAGCFTRIGASTEHLNEEQINNLYSQRTKISLVDIISPTQELTFSQLKIYYQEAGFPINDNFLKQLKLIREEDGKYNYLAYLLSDNNSISIKVATYREDDAYDLIENEEFGYCCLVKACKNVIAKFEIINRTFVQITSAERKELKMFETIPVREAIVNAIVHNAWEREYPPKFEIFSNHLSISSTGGLPLNFTKEDFLKGFSAPKHPELMRVFKDLDLVEQLGTGIIRILKYYDKSIYEFSDNFIRVNFQFKTYNNLVSRNNKPVKYKLNDTEENILHLIKEDSEITQIEMSKILDVNKTTVMRNINNLKSKNIIKRVGNNRKGRWDILD